MYMYVYTVHMLILCMCVHYVFYMCQYNTHAHVVHVNCWQWTLFSNFYMFSGSVLDGHVGKHSMGICFWSLFLELVISHRCQEVNEAVVDLTTEGSSREVPIDLSTSDRCV